MSNPYYYLRNAVSHRNGVCSAWEIRRELAAYLAWLRTPHKPMGDGDFLVIETTARMSMQTREEYDVLVHQRKKRKPKRKKGEADPVKHVYTTVESEQLELREHAPELDSEHVEDLDWIDALARQHEEEIEGSAYHAEW